MSLAPLRHSLAHLRHRRQSVRWGTAAAGFGTALVVILAGAFVLDYSLLFTMFWRALLLLGCVAAALWAWKSLARPWLGTRESEIDLALMVERHQQTVAAAATGDQALAATATSSTVIGRDLVAALQFESPAAATWGSRQLEELVVSNLAGHARGLNVLEGLPTQTLVRRGLWCLLAVGLAALAMVSFPGHARAFFRRLALLPDHYPSATQITHLALNGRPVELANGVQPADTPAAEGQPLKFLVQVTGELPREGRLELTTPAGRRSTVDLKLVDDRVAAAQKPASQPPASQPPPPPAPELRTQATFTASLERLNEPLTYQLYLGDAWTDPADIKLIPLPVVEATLVPTPPEYAAALKRDPGDLAGLHNLEVLEGSQVAVEVTCKNKPLAQVAVVIDEKSYPLVQTDDAGRQWRLAPAGTPLARVAKELKYRLEAVDADGLSPEHLPSGILRILPDRPPRVAAIVKTRHVVPDGAPVVEYRAVDDYGIGKITIRSAVVRESSEGKQRLPLADVILLDGKQPLRGDRLPVDAKHPLPLGQFPLAKGDRLELTVEVIDFRGAAAGKPAETEPLVLQVTDAEGVATAVTELDPALEQQFDALIQRQLDIGATK